ncbi:MAG: dUTP diphosphatase [Candidatus Eremiobacterota bacterium]
MLEAAVAVDTVVKVEKRHPRAQLPVKANASDACFDLVVVEGRRLEPGDTVALETGLAIELQYGWEAQVRGRSGLASRGIVVHPGTIDHLYRQTLKVLVHNLTGRPYIVQSGDRVAQLKISRVWQVELVEGLVEATGRGGLGSTGR